MACIRVRYVFFFFGVYTHIHNYECLEFSTAGDRWLIILYSPLFRGEREYFVMTVMFFWGLYIHIHTYRPTY